MKNSDGVTKQMYEVLNKFINVEENKTGTELEIWQTMIQALGSQEMGDLLKQTNKITDKKTGKEITEEQYREEQEKYRNKDKAAAEGTGRAAYQRGNIFVNGKLYATEKAGKEDVVNEKYDKAKKGKVKGYTKTKKGKIKKISVRKYKKKYKKQKTKLKNNKNLNKKQRTAKLKKWAAK